MFNLFSDEEFNRRFLKALSEVAEADFEARVWYEGYKSDRPRISGLGSCAREQLYSINGTEVTNPRDEAGFWAPTMGRFGQQLAALCLRQMGYVLFDEEKTVGLGSCVNCSHEKEEHEIWDNENDEWVCNTETDEGACDCAWYNGMVVGHIDGKLTGLDLEDKVAIWDSKFKGVWGLYGTNQGPGLVNSELRSGDPSIYLQLQSYIAAEGADLGLITAHPFDLSAARVEASKRKVELSPVYRLIIVPDEAAQQLALRRAKTILAAKHMEVMVPREFEPNTTRFPCIGYCDFHFQCLADGPAYQLSVPEIPWRDN